METKGFFQFEIILNVLVRSFRLMWILIFWVAGHYKYVLLSVLGPSLYVRIYRRQIRTYKDGPRAERVKRFILKLLLILQVTTVELCDLPGCSINTLGKCSQLKALYLNRCNLTALEGIENCKELQYLDVQVWFWEKIFLHFTQAIKHLNPFTAMGDYSPT